MQLSGKPDVQVCTVDSRDLWAAKNFIMGYLPWPFLCYIKPGTFKSNVSGIRGPLWGIDTISSKFSEQ